MHKLTITSIDKTCKSELVAFHFLPHCFAPKFFLVYPQMQKIMTNFQGFTNIMRVLSLIFFVFLGYHATAARRDVIAELSADARFRKEVGYGEEKLSTVVVSGSILCDHACLDENSSLQSQPIPGASLAVLCDTSKQTSKSDWVIGTTDEYGDFLIDLPSHLHAIPNMEKKCIVKVLEMPKSSACHQAFTGEHGGIKFSSRENGICTYTAHEIHLTPKDSEACMKKQATF